VTLRVFILGAGRVGRGLAGALRASGVEVIGLHGRHVDEGVTTGPLPSAVDDADVVIVAVRDTQIEGALKEIAAPRRATPATRSAPGASRSAAGASHRSVVLHVSGSATPDALGDLRSLGHPAGTFHPLVPIAEPAHAADRLRGAWIGLDGDARAIDVGRILARHLGASTLVIPAGQKPRYHAAAVFASNFPAVLAAMAGELLRSTGVSVGDARGAVIALLRASVANLHDGEPAQVLTGPIARGDAATVRAHLEALADDALMREVYRALSTAAVQLLDADPSADHAHLAEISSALNDAR
jgi:predicted short-subunit dehydrogenase-like oxidoreductase (DUF2520 family)